MQNHFLKMAIFPAPLFLCEHADDGSIGFVLNQETDLLLGDILVELSASKEPIFQGGPVQNDTLHMLHRMPDILEGKEVGDGICWGGSFDALQDTILMSAHKPQSLKLFLGYAGWAAGQLQAEMDEGSWLVADATVDIVFNTPVDDIWKKAIALLGEEYRYLSQMPIDPQLN